MNPPEPQCQRCNVPMQAGFLADNADSGSLVQARWVEGVPVIAKFWGMEIGSPEVKDRQTFPIIGYRCPVCCRVEFFAVSEEQPEDVLLRPAGIGEGQNSEELLRGSEAPNP